MSPAEPGAGTGRNLLASASSPYLRQHADNPVHWRPWTPEALAEAAERDVPILLSIGYAACHWCHVMAHESFADEQVAAVMNADFVCIKVDREERPDLDAVYMSATIALTGHGGWPMTCFLTPDGRPFYCGTYYPKAAFVELLAAVTNTWTGRRGELEQASDHIAHELAARESGLPSGGRGLDAQLCDMAVTAVLDDEDHTHGGFGGAPKFPPSTLLEALLRHHERTGAPASLAAVRRAGTAMARGGLYDQLAGGFARYSVDDAWVVPHFEKMLYDNALLLRGYAHWARRTGDPVARRVAAQTAEFLLTELADGDLFASSLDADAAGVEGGSYVWTPAQLAEILGDDDGRWAAAVFDVGAAGTFERGTSVLQLPVDPDDTSRFDRVRTTLLAARLTRAQPARDDKVVSAWNGLAITALAEAAVALDRPDLHAAAAACATALHATHLVDGRLRRTSLGGRVGQSPAGLDDHGMVAVGLLTLYQLDGRRHWLDAALELLETAVAHFVDPDAAGRWFDSADDAEQLLYRPADPIDGPTPSGAAAITEALLLAGCLADGARAERYGQLAAATLDRHAVLLERAPRSAGHWLAVAEAAVTGPLQIAVACDPADSALLAQARRIAPGGAIVVAGAVDSAPLLAGRDRVDGADAAYVCRGRVCALPVTTGDELAAMLRD
ncbi:thioredoxin domain-containing protein [Mycolicibacillus parakoreensis]|uniref:Thioredoxin domain-containing protein n=1 Tax=Mycolicibacillus parakoreensis TaxID=1069221 RepID=A0ABY3U606_9MYCO|nr:thioredoxin domain-containing protein [Mycolicibacillus parakoreensis]MCV7315122.1 thioredoxin domain-containing protein [Mycolicibacillus parakoreensis]ULN53531.1 thioredoxin domain-containing protein [Mycolicibacillus parakoreensis]